MTSCDIDTPVGAEVNLELEVSSLSALAEDVLGITMRDPSGCELPAWAPGAHVDLTLPNGMIRQYSLCGDLSDRTTWAVGILREQASRGGSKWLHAELGIGDRIAVRGPRNHFPLVSEERFLFVAGGIGITPLLPMIAAADAAGIEWQLLYGGRKRQSMAFRDELVDRYGARVLIRPADEYGILDLDGFLGCPQRGTAVYCCGPEKLVAALEDRSVSWPGGSLHVERFHPREGALEGASVPFEVVLERSGKTVNVSAVESILDAVARIGVDVPASCREGTCGTCETAVLDGIPDHRDSFLSREEREDNATMMVCCSRALSSRITLDL